MIIVCKVIVKLADDNSENIFAIKYKNINIFFFFVFVAAVTQTDH